MSPDDLIVTHDRVAEGTGPDLLKMEDGTSWFGNRNEPFSICVSLTSIGVSWENAGD